MSFDVKYLTKNKNCENPGWHRSVLNYIMIDAISQYRDYYSTIETQGEIYKAVEKCLCRAAVLNLHHIMPLMVVVGLKEIHVETLDIQIIIDFKTFINCDSVSTQPQSDPAPICASASCKTAGSTTKIAVAFHPYQIAAFSEYENLSDEMNFIGANGDLVDCIDAWKIIEKTTHVDVSNFPTPGMLFSEYLWDHKGLLKQPINSVFKQRASRPL